jgi:nucleoside phosphorylase
VTDTLILTGIQLEARALASQLELQRCSGFPFLVFERRGDRLVRLAPVGLRATLLPARWAALVADLVSPLVISAGTCGALSPELGIGDLVLPENVLGSSGERLNVTFGVHAAALERSGSARAGLLLTSPTLVETPEAKARCGRATGASAVDMESAAILAWASRQGCPSLVVRAVSDTAQQHLPAQLAGLVTPDGALRIGKALALALTHPRTLPQAFRLRRGTKTALKRVAGFLSMLLG